MSQTKMLCCLSITKLIFSVFASDCSAYSYGSACSLRCHCRDATCDPVTGYCHTGCQDWWVTDTCNTEVGK